MTDLKISELSAITTLDGTEEFVVADSGTTKKIAAANLPGLTLLYSNTLGADAASIDTGANGIAQTHTHLQIFMMLRMTTVAFVGDARIRLNNDSGGSNYFTQRLFGFASTTGATESGASGVVIAPTAASSDAGWFAMYTVFIPFYRAGQRKAMRILADNNNTTFGTTGSAVLNNYFGAWNDTSAISRFAVAAAADNFLAASSVQIYGI